MTSHIQQHVVARPRPHLPRSASFSHTTFYSQRGNLTHQGVMIGFSLLVLISLSVLGFMYLQQVLETASRGNEMQALEDTLTELRTKQRSLELEGAELRSLHTIETKVNSLQLVATDRVAYLGVDSGKVAYAD
jgi:hypothetical protein